MDTIEIEGRVHELVRDVDPRRTEPGDFFAAQFDHGLARVHYPKGLGGLEGDQSLQATVDRLLQEAGAKNALLRNGIGIGMGMPTLLTHGTRALQDRYFRDCFSCREIWCQLFSEPGAGSDLAGLATRAERDGKTWVVSGQKVWTSVAHVARRGLLVARTQPDAPKHKGLSFFVVDMHDPGIEVRPLREMTGNAQFNEVFLTEVRIAADHLVGREGEGWAVANTMLVNERSVLSGAGGGAGTVGGNRIEKLLAAALDGALQSSARRDEAIRCWIEAQVIRWTNQRARATAYRGMHPAMTKILQGLHNRRVQDLAVELHGISSLAWEHGLDGAGTVAHGLLRAQANTIEGGTTNILRNIVGEKVLGLPREPGPDRDTPWSALLRNERGAR